MLFTEIKEKVINGLKSKSINVTINYNFTDELGLKYKFGEINLVELISQMTEDLSYTLVETFDNNFFLCDKKMNFSFGNYIDPKSIQKIWDNEHEEKFITAYPELKQTYIDNKKEINSASCTGCAKNGKIYSLLNEFMFLSHSERPNQFLSDIYGVRFYEKLLSHKAQQKPKKPEQMKTEQIQDKNLEVGNSPRKSCVNCALKHIATAITLFQESRQGLPSHRWLAIGELSEASSEMLRDFPEIANEIKEIRLKLMENGSKIPVLMSLLERLDKQFYPSFYKI